MSKTHFTEEQIAQLSENPYTYQVTANYLLFTKEFKELFWEEYCQGSTPREILRRCGYDTDLLGGGRISGIGQIIKKEAAIGNGFSDGKRPTDPFKAPKDITCDAATFRKMQEELEYLKQEMDFLKKTISARSTRK